MTVRNDAAAPERLGWVNVFLVAVFVYLVLLGGTEAGSVLGSLRALNALLAGVCIGLVLWRVGTDNDRTDLAALLPVAGVVAASSLGAFPRMAIDHAMAAVAWYCAFYLARRMMADPTTARFAATILGLAATALSLVVSLAWGATWLTWLQLSDFGSIPPLNSELPTLVFWHRYVVAGTIVLLLPAQLMLWRRRALRPLVVVALASMFFIVFASGYRALWLGMVLGALVLAVRVGASRWALSRAQVVLGAIVVTAAASAIWMLGFGAPLLDRAMNLATLESRLANWSAVLQLWQQDPVSGVGPGSFAAGLATTDFPRTVGGLLRHADNASIQMLAEGGLLVVIPAILFGVYLLRQGVRSAGSAPVWVLVVFGIVSLTDNPTDFANLNALGIAALAALVPRCRGASSTPLQQPRLWMRSVTYAALGVLAVAFGALSAAAIAYDAGLSRARADNLPDSAAMLSLAVALDPQHALYRREAGLVQLARGHIPAAIAELRRALDVNPNDEETQKALALAYSRTDPDAAARTSAHTARLFPRSSSAALLAATLGDDEPAETSEFLVQALAIDPWLSGSAEWSERFGTAWPPEEIVRSAAIRATSNARERSTADYRAAWLSILAGDAQTTRPPVPSNLIGAGEAWTALLDCRLQDAKSHALRAQPTEADSSVYWIVRIATFTALGLATEEQVQLATIASDSFPVFRNENSLPGFNPGYDRRLYGRQSLATLHLPFDVVSHADGVRAWLTDPVGAARRTAPSSALARCR